MWFLFGISLTLNIVFIIVLYKVKDKLNFDDIVSDKKAYKDFKEDKPYLNQIEKESEKNAKISKKEEININPFFSNR